MKNKKKYIMNINETAQMQMRKKAYRAYAELTEAFSEYDYDVDSYYRGIDERGENIKKAIKQIVKIAREGTQTQSTPLVKFEKKGEFKEDLLNNLYYSQLYNVTLFLPSMITALDFSETNKALLTVMSAVEYIAGQPLLPVDV